MSRRNMLMPFERERYALYDISLTIGFIRREEDLERGRKAEDIKEIDDMGSE